MKVKKTILLLCIYCVLVIGFGFWWAENFDGLTHFKGDESIFEIEYIGIITYAGLIIFRILNNRLYWWFILVMPVLICLLSVFITLFLPIPGLFGSTLLDNLRYYGIVHTLATILTVCLQLELERKNRSHRA